MPKYIEREALLKDIDDLKKSPWYNDDYGNGTRQARHDGINCVVDLCIKQAPAADVVEVRHGRWVEEGCGLLVCSKCNFEYDHSGMPFEGLYYCPNCGAKMDGDKNG